MISYFALVFIPLFIYIINNKCRVRIGKKEVFKTHSLSIDVFMVFFLFLLGLRGQQCGNDTIQYLRLYKRYSLSDFSSLVNDGQIELGFKLLNKAVSFIFDDFQMLLIISALICVCPIWYFYKKESEIEILTLALFLTVAPFGMYFSGIRQTIAMAIGIGAWYATKNKKILLFLFIVFVAMQFHTSAFVLLLVYPLYHARITKKWLWFIIPCMAVVYIFRETIFGFMMTFLWKDYNATPETGAYMILLLLIIFAIYSYVIVDEKLLDQDTIALRNILLLSVVIQIFAMLHPLSMRMNYYFLIFIPILIPKIANRCKYAYRSIGKLSVVIMTIYFIGYFINNVIGDKDSLNIYPYIPFWENL